MTTFRKTKTYAEQATVVRLLSEIEQNPSFTQRGLSANLGIALGLTNQYLKRCVTKGWVRAKQVSPRRITYFLTPSGFTEKSRMVAGYLSSSLTFFRDAKAQCEQLISYCEARTWQNIALIGAGDLADIVQLVARETAVKTVVLSKTGVLENYDAVLVTDIETPQETYDFLAKRVDHTRLLVPDILHISKAKK